MNNVGSNKQCENCSILITEKYGSGRFCSSQCARSFSTKKNRNDISKKVSNTLKGRASFTEKQLLSRREWGKKWGKKWGAIQREKKMMRLVNIRGDILDITYGQLEEYRKTHLACEMCGVLPNTSRNGMNKNLAIDHSHKTMKFRGLLCVSCNRFLGYYENSKLIAEEYLNTRH